MKLYVPFFFVCLVFVAASFAVAADEGADASKAAPGAVTVKDPAISVEQLALMLRPLTKEELVIEADAWLALVKAKVREISDAEIARILTNEEIDRVEQAIDAVEEAKEAKEEARDPEKAEEVEKSVKKAQDVLEEAKKSEEKTKEHSGAADAIKKAQEEAAKKAGEEAAKPEDAVESAVEKKVAIKTQLLDRMTKLRAQQTALIDRTATVLDELKKKGGEIEQYERYLSAVSGIDLDVTDAGATYSAVIGWITSEEGGIRWAFNILKFLLILLAFYIFSVICGRLAKKAINAWKGLSEILKAFLVKAVRRTVLVVGFIISLSALEINIGPVVAIVGAAGFVIAFALQGTLSNFASGLLIMFYRPFDVGDVVDVAGIGGKVASMNLMSTHIKTFDNKSVTVPNNSIWGGVITNATGNPQRRVDMVFGIGYGDSIDKAMTILEKIVKGHELVLKDPEPVIRVHELGDSSVNFICRPWVKTADYWKVYWDVTAAVKKQFDEEGVSIPFPQHDVHIHQSAASGE